MTSTPHRYFASSTSLNVRETFDTFKEALACARVLAANAHASTLGIDRGPGLSPSVVVTHNMRTDAQLDAELHTNAYLEACAYFIGEVTNVARSTWTAREMRRSLEGALERIHPAQAVRFGSAAR